MCLHAVKVTSYSSMRCSANKYCKCLTLTALTFSEHWPSNAVWIRLLYNTRKTERSDRMWTTSIFNNTRWGFVDLVMNLDVCHRQWKFVQITSSALKTGCMSGRYWAAENGSTWEGSSSRLQVSWKHHADGTDCSSSGVTGQVRVISQRSCNLVTTRALRRDKQLHAVRRHP